MNLSENPTPKCSRRNVFIDLFFHNEREIDYDGTDKSAIVFDSPICSQSMAVFVPFFVRFANKS